jgi:hypothetical protein
LEARRPIAESRRDLIAARAHASATLDALWADIAAAMGYEPPVA